jgi:hypothetical protein
MIIENYNDGSDNTDSPLFLNDDNSSDDVNSINETIGSINVQKGWKIWNPDKYKYSRATGEFANIQVSGEDYSGCQG